MTEDLIPNCYHEPEVSPEKISDWQFAFGGLIIVLLVICFLTLPVSAQTITVSNPGAMVERDIAVYYPNATSGDMEMLGLYNTSSTIITDGNVSYIFSLVPISTNPLTDPADWLTNQAFPFVQSNVIAIGVICFFIGLALFWRR